MDIPLVGKVEFDYERDPGSELFLIIRGIPWL